MIPYRKNVEIFHAMSFMSPLRKDSLGLNEKRHFEMYNPLLTIRCRCLGDYVIYKPSAQKLKNVDIL